METVITLWSSTGLQALNFGMVLMIGVGLLLVFLAIRFQFEPLLLLPIGFGAILTNIPLAGLNEPGGLLFYLYQAGVSTACSRC